MAQVFSDASFAGGTAALAAIVSIGDEEITLTQIMQCKGSNIAEYEAAILGCRWARYQGFAAVHVHTDSELMAKQFDGRVKTRSERLCVLLGQLRHYAKAIHHTPSNPLVREADAATRHALLRMSNRR